MDNKFQKKDEQHEIQNSKGENVEVDEELDALLDSALEDFDKPVTNKSETAVPDSAKSVGAAGLSSDGVGENTTAAFAQFEETMRSFLEEDPAFKEHIQKLTDAAKSATKGTDEEFAASLADTLKSLAENAQSISGNPSEDDVTRLLGNLGIGSGSNDGTMTDLLPLMQNVMQSLLSKELLYPALRDIVDKYPEWLAHHRSELEESVYDKYNLQYDLMKQVCEAFETEKDEDSDDVKKSRFQHVLQLMQKMQDCGQPPKELVGELGPGLELDEQGNLKLPGLSEQCNLM